MPAILRASAAALLCAPLVAILLSSCGGSKKPVIVGSKNETEQMILGEIVAQHLEHRLGRTIERRLGLGNTPVLYQSIISGEVGIYPEYTGLIESEILKEPADPDPRIVWTRVNGEMDRIAQLDVLDPLGFDNRTAIVVGASGTEKLATLSDAVKSDRRWRLGITSEFQSRSDGFQELSLYRLTIEPPRILDPKQLFSELEKGREKGGVDMIATRATDGRLTLPNWKILTDNRDPRVFPPYEACLLVRKDLIRDEPALRPALAELSGRLNAATIRKLNAQVDIELRPVAAVAADFLTQAGLK